MAQVTIFYADDQSEEKGSAIPKMTLEVVSNLAVEDGQSHFQTTRLATGTSSSPEHLRSLASWARPHSTPAPFSLHYFDRKWWAPSNCVNCVGDLVPDFSLRFDSAC